MKSTLRKQLFHFSIVLTVAILSANLQAAENPITSLWPFGKNKTATPSVANPFSASKNSSSGSLLAGPARLMNKAEKQTQVMFRKTKSGFKGVHDFGRSLNPFTKKPTEKPNKKSLLDRVFPKQPVDGGPATVGEFLNMDRPGF